MKVSLILTVLNEERHIGRLFDSILTQTRLPDEVVVCDGGSTDGTVAVVQSFADRLPIALESAPGANISTGRNVAIRAASGEIIAVTDAGVWLESHWLERLVRPFAANPFAEKHALCAGFFVAEAETAFEVAMGATVLPELADLARSRFLPSSRSVAFRKAAWEAVGGYPEWLDYSEDVVYDLALRKKFGAFALALDARARFRPRGSLRAFARQYFNYASGDAQAGLFGHIHFVRYFTYLVALPLGLFAALTVSPWLWLVGAAAGLAYVRTPLRRLRNQWGELSAAERTASLLFVPVIRVTGDLAKMCGYPIGLWKKNSTQRRKGAKRT